MYFTDAGIEELEWWTAETSARLRAVRETVESFAPWLLPVHRKVFRQLEAEPARSEKRIERLTLEALPPVLADLDAKLQRLSEDALADEPTRLAAQSLRELLPASMREAETFSEKLKALAAEADALVRQMDFGFLYNKRRKVLSVGYDVRLQRLEASCYEMLASEARTAAFAAIAKGDVPQESWFHLGRTHVLRKGEQVLLSWSGTMFEYLMPALWMKSYPNTILDQTLHAAVRCQQEMTKSKRIPWGISEAASSKKDPAGHYQYKAFGMPALASNPGALEALVVSPYATFLALAADASGAVRNLRRMQEMGWLGRFGFYEAADFEPSGAIPPEGYELVRCWMAHHQGMSLLAACNLLADSTLEELFHAEPLVAATERLLHERLPLGVRVESADQPPRGERTAPRETPARKPDAIEYSEDAHGERASLL